MLLTQMQRPAVTDLLYHFLSLDQGTCLADSHQLFFKVATSLVAALSCQNLFIPYSYTIQLLIAMQLVVLRLALLKAD